MSISYIVRHGVTRFLGKYDAEGDAAFARGTEVILRTERGQEIGEVLCEATTKALEMLSEPTGGKIVRSLTHADRDQLEKHRDAERREFETCRNLIEQRKLQM